MLQRVMVALAATELVLAVALGLGVRYGSASDPQLAALLGALTMALVLVPATGMLLWGRERSHALFLTTVVVTFLGKLALIGATLAFVLLRTTLPRLEFILGLLVGWVVGFLVQSWLLRGSHARTGRLERGA